MPQSSTPTTTAAALQTGAAASSAGGVVTRAALLRALGMALLLVAGLGVVAGVVLYGGALAGSASGEDGAPLPRSTMPYFLCGLCAAAFAAIGTIYLHGRFAATKAPQGDPSRTAVLVTGRLQTLLAMAFGAKLAVLVLGVFALKQFPLVDGGTKFPETATFAVTFAAAALICQLATAGVLARSLRRP